MTINEIILNFSYLSVSISTGIVICSYFSTLKSLKDLKYTKKNEDIIQDKNYFLNIKIIQTKKTIFKIICAILWCSLILTIIYFNFPVYLYDFFEKPNHTNHTLNRFYIYFIEILFSLPEICNEIYFRLILIPNYRKEDSKISLGKKIIFIVSSFIVKARIFYYFFLFLILRHFHKNIIEIFFFYSLGHFFFVSFVSALFFKSRKKLIESEIPITLLKKLKVIADKEKFNLKNIHFKRKDKAIPSSIMTAFYFSFFYLKLIAFTENFLEQSTEEEIISVLYHELCHHKSSDITFNFLQYLIYLCCTYILLKTFVKFFPYEIADYICLILFYYKALSLILTIFLSAVINAFSRFSETRADEYSVSKTRSLSLESALRKIYISNCSDMFSSKFETILSLGYDPFIERIMKIRNKHEKIKNKTVKEEV